MSAPAKSTPKAKPTPKKAAGKAVAKPAAEKAAPKKVGAPSLYTPELVERICAHIADGKSLRTIEKLPGIPTVTTIMRWLEDKPEFRDRYARAREAQADKMAEEILAIADEITVSKVVTPDGEVELRMDSTAVARNRLRVDARKWLASKMAPKKYGDKLGIGQADGMDPLKVDKQITNADRAVRILDLLKKSGKTGGEGSAS